MNQNKELLTKIGSIQANITSLIKDEKVKLQTANYKYFEESQLLKILKPLLAENKLTMLISDDDSQPLNWEREGNKHYLRYLKKMEISDQGTGQTLIFKFWASGDNTDLAKAKGSAETYAMKYILSKFFLIRVIDENDPELLEKENKELSPEEKKTVAELLAKHNLINPCNICQKDFANHELKSFGNKKVCDNCFTQKRKEVYGK